MAGRHAYAALRARMSPAARRRAAQKAEKLGKEMDLAELRRAHALSQVELARALGVQQAAVAKMEARTDMYVSTLRRLIRAIGGELRIVAHFGAGDVIIHNFSELSRGSRHDAVESRPD